VAVILVLDYSISYSIKYPSNYSIAATLRNTYTHKFRACYKCLVKIFYRIMYYTIQGCFEYFSYSSNRSSKSSNSVLKLQYFKMKNMLISMHINYFPFLCMYNCCDPSSDCCKFQLASCLIS